LKLASGCDRRCSFCAIPSFRGAFVSRQPEEVLAEARWLAEHGVRELVLVSENSTSYGKDLGDVRALERLLPALAAVDGVARVRLTYLQPAELRPSLIDVMTSTPGVVPYFDLSFQHASGSVLRRMRRFGDSESFLRLLDGIRERVPTAGARSNVIVGFPGETHDELAELEEFLQRARLDVVGVFGYSDEDGTHAATLPDKLDPDDVRERAEKVSALVDELLAQRAEERVGEVVEVLVDRVAGSEDGGAVVEGRADHQAPEVDGVTLLRGCDARPGELVKASIVSADGVDLIGAPAWPARQ
jgi:MiaB/RimO family radical SAM methylthiotransferase